MGKLIALLALALALGIAAALGVSWWLGRGASQALAAAEKQAGQAVVAGGQAQAATATLHIITEGQARERSLAAIAQENSHAIEAAPGADRPLDPGFIQRLDGGLCRYAAYRDDPGCAELRGADPALLSRADPAGPAP